MILPKKLEIQGLNSFGYILCKKYLECMPTTSTWYLVTCNRISNFVFMKMLIGEINGVFFVITPKPNIQGSRFEFQAGHPN